MPNALELSLSLPIGSLDAYQQAVSRFPLLSESEERALAERLRRDNDLEAARQLVMSHLRFVVRVARGYRGYGLADADLIQEGSVGLMKAVKRFDPDVGVRLVSFAVHWIRAEIHEFVLRNWRIVKVATTKAQRKLFFNLRSRKKRLGWLNHKEVEGVASDLGVKPETVLEMEKRLYAHDAAFDGHASSGDDSGESTAPAAYLGDLSLDPASRHEEADWTVRSQERLRAALETLDARSRDILGRRWLGEEKATLGELAAEYGVSAERIRQIEKKALGSLRGLLEN